MATRKDVKKQEEQLLDALRDSLDEAEKLLREAADATGDKASELRARAMESLTRTREGLADAQDALVEHGRRAVQATDEYVHEKPWQALAIAGLSGLIVGALLVRR